MLEVILGMVVLLEDYMDVRYSALKVGSDGIFWCQKAGVGIFLDDPAFLRQSAFFNDSAFWKSQPAFGDESWGT
jgi:hypothetical protein